MSLLSYLWDHRNTVGVILFYGAIILLLYIYRKRFQGQGIIRLYKTKLGLRYMDRIVNSMHPTKVRTGERLLKLLVPVLIASLLGLVLTFMFFKENIILYRVFFWTFSAAFLLFLAALLHYKPIVYAAHLGIWVGYIGMLIIVIFIIYGLVQLIVNPSAPPPIQPVIPGVSIPGSGIKVPLIIGWIALFISAVIHEFSHGVVSRAHKIKVTSSGFAFIGPLAAAFVEPDEKQLKKTRARVQTSIFAAGPFSNILLALLMFLILTFLLTPIIGSVLTPAGFSFTEVTKGSPADQAGVREGVTYTEVNGMQVLSTQDFFIALENVTPGSEVVIANDEVSHTIIAGASPKNESKAYLGVNLTAEYTNMRTWWATILLWIFNLFNWIFIISLGLGLANLLPLGPVDGGRMFHTASLKTFGKKIGKKVWTYVTLVFIALLVILLWPIIKATLTAIVRLFF